MNFFDYILIIIFILIILVFIRTLIGPTIWDRLLGFNMISSKIIMAIVIYSVTTRHSYYLDVALAYSMLGFIGTIIIARFIEKRGNI